MSETRVEERAPEPLPPVTPVPRAPVSDPSAWRVGDFASPADYTIELSAAQLRDVADWVRRVKAAGLGLDDLQREHFDIASLDPAIDEIGRQVEAGRGFAVVRRLPVEDYA